MTTTLRNGTDWGEAQEGAKGWKVCEMCIGEESDEVEEIYWGPVTGDRADLNTKYTFFDSKEEAARAFLKKAKEHPGTAAVTAIQWAEDACKSNETSST